MTLKRTVKSCRSDAPMLASSLREGAQATVSNKPGHRGEREVSRKTIARGMPGLFRCTCGDYARVLCLISHARLWVHWAPGIPCALCFSGRTVFCKNSGASRRGNAESYLKLKPRHCEERPIRRSSTSDRVRRSSQSEGGRRKRRSNPDFVIPGRCKASNPESRD